MYYLFDDLVSNFFSLDKYYINKSHKEVFGIKPNLTSPKTLNEKIQWLKINDRDPFYTLCADKYLVRSYLDKNFGSENLIPLVYQTTKWQNIKPENMPNYPFIIKGNHGSGMNIIVRNKKEANWREIQNKCRKWLGKNYYYRSREWQYKNITPRIVVEKLLLDKGGRIPNDYKLHYFNGKLMFVYCSVDREGGNYRNIYSPSWKPLPFSWVAKKDHRKNLVGPIIKKPLTYNKMVKIGNEIAKNFKLVRVDFYDIDGKMYFGEITLHHGGGFDTFMPKKYDLYYGKRLDLSEELKKQPKDINNKRKV